MAMKAYESYKNVDLPWLKRVPEHWEVNKINRLFNLISSGTTPNSGKINFYENGNIPWLNSGDLYGDKPLIEKTAKHVTQSALNSFSTLKLYSANSIAIAMYGASVGNISIVPFEFCCNQACCVFSKPIKNLNLKYVYYSVIAGKKDLIEQARGGGQPNINQDILKQFRLPFPPFHEQEQIVRYLDWQNSRLNKLINAKKKEIALLEEQKQALISQAVTKGLDPHAPLKDSGIDYIGYIPKHWRVLQNRRLYSSVSRKYSDKQLVLSLSQKDGLIPYENMSERSLHTSSYDNWKLVLENDLVLNRFKAHLGVFFASDYNGIVTFHYGVYEPKFPIISKFYEALYHTESYKCAYAGQSRGMTVGLQNLSDTDFYSIYTVYPPYKEQIKISNYIKRLEYSFSKYREQLTQYISLLQEYRTRLVTDVVTGQIDVRNIAIPNYETVAETADQPETTEDESAISAEDQ